MNRLAVVIPGVVCALACVALACWLAVKPAVDLKLREPTGASAAVAPTVESSAFPLPGVLEKGSGEPANLPGAWAQFRGPRHDGISTETVPLLKSFASGGPKPLWSVALGYGYAAPAVLNGRVYLLDYDAVKKADALRCLSLADGREIWRRFYSVPVAWQHGMSRTMPAVTEKYVVTLGPKCHVLCADAATGQALWSIDLVKEYGTKVPPWYAGQCPLIDNGRAIIAPGGSALLIAVDCATGKVLWRTPNPRQWSMTHSSVLPLEFRGRRMYVYCANDGVVGVSAEDGSVLWELTGWVVPMANVPMPVAAGEDRLFLTGGYGAGSVMLTLRQAEGRITAEAAYRLKPDAFASEQQTPLYYDGCLYGTMSKDSGTLREQFVCLDAADGSMKWASGPENRFGPFGGPYMIAGGMILLMNDDGVLTLLEATSAGYHQLARVKVLDGPESWAPMALAGGRLLVRDRTRMVCLDLRAVP